MEIDRDALQIVRKLGEGSFGSAFLVTHGSDLCVMKVADREVDDRASSRRRFEREFTASRAIGHPCVVRIHGVFETPSGHPALLMEYVVGSTLSSILGRSAPLSNERIRAIFEPLADALAAVHAHDLVHRDLRGDNVMVTRTEDDAKTTVRLLDFGLVRDAVLRPVSRGIASPASDVYALGALLWWACTGEPLDDDPLAAIGEAADAQAPDPRRLVPALDGELAGLVCEMLSGRPEERPSAAAVNARLATLSSQRCSVLGRVDAELPGAYAASGSAEFLVDEATPPYTPDEVIHRMLMFSRGSTRPLDRDLAEALPATARPRPTRRPERGRVGRASAAASLPEGPESVSHFVGRASDYIAQLMDVRDPSTRRLLASNLSALAAEHDAFALALSARRFAALGPAASWDVVQIHSRRLEDAFTSWVEAIALRDRRAA